MQAGRSRRAAAAAASGRAPRRSGPFCPRARPEPQDRARFPWTASRAGRTGDRDMLPALRCRRGAAAGSRRLAMPIGRRAPASPGANARPGCRQRRPVPHAPDGLRQSARPAPSNRMEEAEAGKAASPRADAGTEGWTRSAGELMRGVTSRADAFRRGHRPQCKTSGSRPVPLPAMPDLPPADRTMAGRPPLGPQRNAGRRKAETAGLSVTGRKGHGHPLRIPAERPRVPLPAWRLARPDAPARSAPRTHLPHGCRGWHRDGFSKSLRGAGPRRGVTGAEAGPVRCRGHAPPASAA